MLPDSPAAILVGYEMSHLGKRVVCSSQVGLAVSTLPPSSPQASTLVTTGDVWTGEGCCMGAGRRRWDSGKTLAYVFRA